MGDKLYSVKMVSENRVGGYLVVYGDNATKDLDGEYFTPQTNFELEWFEQRPMLYHHGLDGAVKTSPVGVIDTIKADQVGLWAEGQLAMRNQYVEQVKRLVNQGALGWSSGSMAHLVQKDNDGKIKRWPVVEGSLTPTPAEPRMTNVSAIKSAFAALKLDGDLDLLRGDPAQDEPEAAGSRGESSGENLNGDKQTEVVMTDNNTAVVDAMKAELGGLKSALLGELNKAAQDTGAVRDAQAQLEAKIAKMETAIKTMSGAFTEQAASTKSLGETLMAVKSSRVNRRPLEDGLAVKSMGGDVGGSGGYLLARRFGLELLTAATEESWLLPLLRVFPVAERSGDFPVLNMYGVTAAGNNPKAGGAAGAKRAEGGTYTETGLTFENVSFNINNAISGQIPVKKELVKDSPISLEVILTSAIQSIYRYKLEYLVFNGTGIGEPLGIFNSGALFDVTPATNSTFARADASAMAARLYTMNGQQNVRWVGHYGMMSDVDALDASTANTASVMTNGTAQRIQFIKQYPLEYSYNVPVADASGSMNLIDFSAYILLQRTEGTGEAVEINYYDQNSLTEDVWTFDARMDGQPVHRSTINTVAPGGTTYATSSFVRFND